MKKRTFYYIIIAVIFLLSFTLNSCGGSPSSDGSASESETIDDGSASENTPATNMTLYFNLNLQLDSDDEEWDFGVNLPDTYEIYMTLNEDYTITLRAQNMPKMVYRVCTLESETTGCHAYSDKTDGVDIDLVIDSCGRFVSDSDCGSEDDSEFSGILNDDGSLYLTDVSIRIRAFMVTENLDGYLAEDSAEGLFEINRLILDLTTDIVISGDLEASGEIIIEQAVVLVAAGSVSSVSEAFPGADFTAILDGTFDTDPLLILN